MVVSPGPEVQNLASNSLLIPMSQGLRWRPRWRHLHYRPQPPVRNKQVFSSEGYQTGYRIATVRTMEVICYETALSDVVRAYKVLACNMPSLRNLDAVSELRVSGTCLSTCQPSIPALPDVFPRIHLALHPV